VEPIFHLLGLHRYCALLWLLFIACLAARPSSERKQLSLYCNCVLLTCYVAMGHSCEHQEAHLLCNTDSPGCGAHIYGPFCIQEHQNKHPTQSHNLPEHCQYLQVALASCIYIIVLMLDKAAHPQPQHVKFLHVTSWCILSLTRACKQKLCMCHR